MNDIETEGVKYGLRTATHHSGGFAERSLLEAALLTIERLEAEICTLKAQQRATIVAAQ